MILGVSFTNRQEEFKTSSSSAEWPSVNYQVPSPHDCLFFSSCSSSFKFLFALRSNSDRQISLCIRSDSQSENRENKGYDHPT